MIKQKLRVKDIAEAKVTFRPELHTGFQFRGHFKAECFDKHGNLKWTDEGKNLVVNEGLNAALNYIFHGTTQVSPWYVGCKVASGGQAAGDTLASHGSWAEFDSYTGDRKEYVEGAASGQAITNSGSPAAFAITASGTIAGAFICSVATGSGGTLFCVADFTVSRSVDNGDTVNITYSLTTADDGV